VDRIPRSRRRLLLAVAVASTATLLGVPSAGAAVNYPDFSSTAGLTLNGSAHQVRDLLRITEADFGQIGSAFTEKRVVKEDRPFTTSFRIKQHDGSSADGMAFVVQSGAPDALGLGGGGQGYAGIDNSLIVEFDIFQNNENNDPSSNHVAVMTNGDPANHLEADDPGYFLIENATRAWVHYSAVNHKVRVWVTKKKHKPRKALLTAPIDLADILDGNGYAGFTGSTGLFNEAQDVLSWKLRHR
jgi:hypothetical protein